MQLLFVADGPRDRAAIPELVEQLLNKTVHVEFRAWKQLRLSRGSGYHRKLRFALRQARDQELDGVVATVDTDSAKRRERLSLLHSARNEDRQNPRFSPIPAALGEAVPHLEAWLLDDTKAVIDVLQLGGNSIVPNVVQTDPKNALDALIQESERVEGPTELLSEIAKNIDVNRCNHSSETGFDEFVQDVHNELGPRVPAIT